MTDLDLIERNCDLCQGNVLDPIYVYQHSEVIAGKDFQWTVRNVVCAGCGFAFVSPVPSQDFMDTYFRNKVSISPDMKVDYSIPKRLELIRKYLTPCDDKTFVEIGSNNCPEFQRWVSSSFGRYLTVELSNECNSEYGHIDQLPHNCADMLVAYFVVDNLAAPIDFLRRCRDALKTGGHIILEVPDIRLYGKNPSGISSFEHLSHFSPRTLAYLGKKVGLEVLDITQELSSRDFGFAIVFHKGKKSSKAIVSDKIGALQARSFLHEGKTKMDRFYKKQEKIRALMYGFAAKGHGVVVWGMNGVCQDLLAGFQMQSSIVVCDSDPRKLNQIRGIIGKHPSEILGLLKEAKLLVINSPRHIEEITEFIYSNTGRRFKPDEIESNSIVSA